MAGTEKQKYTITYGGWYQRTTIHLSEIYLFLAKGRSYLKLSRSKLERFHRELKIKDVKREAGHLEYVQAVTSEGIEIRYYEDGLYVLELDASDIERACKTLEDYFQNFFEPAINYIFSLGAPTPKILANIKTVHPFVIGVRSDQHKNYVIDRKRFGEIYSQITSNDITVYKTPEYIFVVASKGRYKQVSDLNEMQIFFREFKDHLEKYLQIHRALWEEIAFIKKMKNIKGIDIPKVRAKLDSYSKTVTLISRRINQMGSYVRTRASIAKYINIREDLSTLFQYKFETLTNTLDYIKEIWAMTREYLDSAIGIIVELQSQTTDTGLKSLRLVTTFGALAGTISYISANRVPELTAESVLFFVGLLVGAILLDRIVVFVYQRVKYKMKFGKDVVKIS
ncbi:hypothetical protein JW766_05610 [Candidatus Dojkabacteria bacterium]|nr:hypothetical protein [Candidatus Dojkabacteria bacterium]